MPRPDVAIVIGRPEDSPVGEEVATLARGSGFDFIEKATHEEAANLFVTDEHLGSGCAVMLLCSQCVVHDSLPNVVKALKRQRPDSGKIVVYAQYEWSGVVALDCIEAGAYDFLVPDSDRAELSWHITRAFHGESAYPVYTAATGLLPGAQVFIATRYDYDGRQHFNLGIAVALEHLELKPKLGLDEMGTEYIWQKIQGQIEASKLVIANISQYGGKGVSRYVTREEQYARSKNVPVLLIRCADPRKGGNEPVPANLKGRDWWDYYTCADLALKLYFGLRPCMKKA
ncbi:MAG: hypothetical protein ABSA59_07250 [Terriglobia bacterium]|jgi:hypothetical protein